MLFVKMGSFWIRVGPNPLTSILIRRENRHRHPHTHREAGHVKTEAEISDTATS